MFWTVVGAIFFVLLVLSLCSSLAAASEAVRQEERTQEYWGQFWAAEDRERDRRRGFYPGEREWVQRANRQMAGEDQHEDWGTPGKVAVALIIIFVLVMAWLH